MRENITPYPMRSPQLMPIREHCLMTSEEADPHIAKNQQESRNDPQPIASTLQHNGIFGSAMNNLNRFITP